MNTAEIKNSGYIVKDDLITGTDLESLQAFTRNSIEEFKGRNFRLYDKDFDNSIISSPAFNNKIDSFIQNIIKNEYPEFSNKSSDIYKVLRVVAGAKQKEQANLFHFDAHLITILIPIIIPDNANNKNGDLVILPNIRRVHKYLILNIIQKIFFQNKIVRKILSKFSLKNFLDYKILKLKVGNIYAFNGFTTLHGNMEIDEGSVRATLLVHAYDIFKNSSIIKNNRKRSIMKEVKNIQ